MPGAEDGAGAGPPRPAAPRVHAVHGADPLAALRGVHREPAAEGVGGMKARRAGGRGAGRGHSLVEGDAALAAPPGVARGAAQRGAAPRHGRRRRACRRARATVRPPIGHRRRPRARPPPRHWPAGPSDRGPIGRGGGGGSGGSPSQPGAAAAAAQPVARGHPQRQWEPRLPPLFIAEPATPAASPAVPPLSCAMRPGQRPPRARRLPAERPQSPAGGGSGAVSRLS